MTHSFSETSKRPCRIYASDLLNARGNRELGDLGFAGVLLHDRDEAGIEESDLEEHEERQRAVDLIRERVEDRRREIQAERELDERLDRHRLGITLPDPIIGGALDLVLRRPRELGLLDTEPPED